MRLRRRPVLRCGRTLGFRHDFNDNGFGTVSNGNAINLSFNIPNLYFARGYLEPIRVALAGASGGPPWKAMIWLTLPIKAVKGELKKSGMDGMKM